MGKNNPSAELRKMQQNGPAQKREDYHFSHRYPREQAFMKFLEGFDTSDKAEVQAARQIFDAGWRAGRDNAEERAGDMRRREELAQIPDEKD